MEKLQSAISRHLLLSFVVCLQFSAAVASLSFSPNACYSCQLHLVRTKIIHSSNLSAKNIIVGESDELLQWSLHGVVSLLL